MTIDGGGRRLLDQANFKRAVLQDMRFFGSLHGADFSVTTLARSSFIGCFLDRSVFRGASMSDVVIASSQAARCRFEGVSFSYCTCTDDDFEKSVFAGAEMEHVIFERCNFTGADLSQVGWENTEFVDCRGLPPSLKEIEGVQVIVGKAPAERSPTALGATPRLLSRSSGEKVPHPVSTRYAGAGTNFRPPLGYRLQTLNRDILMWVMLGSGYRHAREEYLKLPEAAYFEAFPRSRLLSAFRTLIGLDRAPPDASLCAMQYGTLIADLRSKHSPLRGAAFPELVLVDGDFPRAHFVDIGDESYIVVSRGLEVTAIRMARYCIAWVTPSAISYMDRRPLRDDDRTIRSHLLESLSAFASSRGDISGVGRLQVSGLRDTQATCLGMTFLRFALGHELAHFLQAREVLPPVDSPLALETQADVHAARALRSDPELDGDTTLTEAVTSLSPAEARAALQLGAAIVRLRGMEVGALPDADLDPSSADFIAGIDRFAQCDWFAAAVAAFILILGGSAGFHGSRDPVARILAAVRGAYGEQAATELSSEMGNRAGTLGMLRYVFQESQAANPA